MSEPREPDPQRLIAAHAAANEFYRARIQSEPRALMYLRSRGIVAATAHTAPWTLGYAPRGWTHLRDHLREIEYRDDELVAAGLVTKASNGNLIDVFRDRVTFPIRNLDGDIAAFTGRDLSGRDDVPKYRNTATTAIYRKSELLYGLTEQLGGDRQPAAVMLVEGPADVLAMCRLRQPVGADDYRQLYVAVAPCGTALTAAQVVRLIDAVPPGTPLVVAFDSDAAGQGATEKSYELLRGWPGPVDAVAMPAGTDPAELVAQGRDNAMQVLEQGRQPLVDLLIDQRLARFRLDEIPGRLNALNAVAPLMADIAARDSTHAARLSAHLAARLHLDPVTVVEAVYPPKDDAASIDTISDGSPDVTDDATHDDDTSEDDPEPDSISPEAAPGQQPAQRAPTPFHGARDPYRHLVGHRHAGICRPAAPAAIWVQDDPATGHTAWVLAEGVTDTPRNRYAARLAAEVAGRSAVLVGARAAVQIARAAINAHFTQPDAGHGDAAIAVLTSFDGDRPVAGSRPYTIAWAGDITAYGSTRRGFAPLIAAHTLLGRARHSDPDAPVVAGDGALTASVRAGAIGVNRIEVPLTQIVLAGRALAHTAPDNIRRAVEWRTPANAVDALVRHGDTATAALVIRPRPAPQGRVDNAARLAQQDQAAGAATPATGTSSRRHARPALPAAPARRPPTR